MRMRPCSLTILLAILACLSLNALAVEYHVDSRNGDDANSGLTPDEAWLSLQRVNAAEYAPGDQVLFHAGGEWRGQLVIQAQGEPGNPVIFRAYGDGPMPRIDAQGEFEDAVLIHNANYVEVRGLEVANRGEGVAPRRGVHILAENAGTVREITVSDLYVHNVNGTQQRKDNGGIIFRTRGDRVPTRFDGLRIERNVVWKVDRSGIVAQSSHWRRDRWYPSYNVVIRDNWVGDVGGDGITPWATEGALIEHNIVQGANERAESYNAGIWPWSTDKSVFRLNRAGFVKTLLDGQGFDSDYNSRNTLFEYNLSHDNEGGFFLICSPGERNPDHNIGNQGTVVRRNISRNDRARIFHVSAAEQTLVEENAVYVGAGIDVQMLLVSSWTGWPDGLALRRNLFHVDGMARYGQGVRRRDDGSYVLRPGWGDSRDVVFSGNRYVGEHIHRPDDDSDASRAPQPITFDDWPGPHFDPRRPETFSGFLKDHRAWMLDLMERQFGSL